MAGGCELLVSVLTQYGNVAHPAIVEKVRGVCMYVRMYVCMYVCVFVCMCVSGMFECAYKHDCTWVQ